MARVTEAGAVKHTFGVAAIVLALWASGCYAQSAPAFSVNPAMTRGPAAAPVTIVEFSDYQ